MVRLNSPIYSFKCFRVGIYFCWFDTPSLGHLLNIHTFSNTKKGGKRNSTVPWSVRYKVAIGIAQAINYLHNETERCVKPSNVLLSSKKFPKAKPLLQKGKGGIGELLDPVIKCTLRNTTQIIQMIQAAVACVSSEESLRPGIREISSILRGEEDVGKGGVGHSWRPPNQISAIQNEEQRERNLWLKF